MEEDELLIYPIDDRSDTLAFEAGQISAWEKIEHENSFTQLLIYYDDYQRLAALPVNEQDQLAVDAARSDFFDCLMASQIRLGESVERDEDCPTVDPEIICLAIKSDREYRRLAQYMGSHKKDLRYVGYMRERRQRRLHQTIVNRRKNLAQTAHSDRVQRQEARRINSTLPEDMAPLVSSALSDALNLETMNRVIDQSIAVLERYTKGKKRRSGEPSEVHAVRVESYFWQTLAHYQNDPRYGFDLLSAATWRDGLVYIRIHDLVEDFFPTAFLTQTDGGRVGERSYQLVLRSRLAGQDEHRPNLQAICNQYGWTLGTDSAGDDSYQIQHADQSALSGNERRTLQTLVYKHEGKRWGIVFISEQGFQLRLIEEQITLRPNEYYGLAAMTNNATQRKAAEETVDLMFPDVAAKKDRPPYDKYYRALCKVISQTDNIDHIGEVLIQETHSYQSVKQSTTSEIRMRDITLIWPFLATMYLSKHMDKLDNLLTVWGNSLNPQPSPDKARAVYAKVGMDIITSIIEGSLLDEKFRHAFQKNMPPEYPSPVIEPPVDLARLGILMIYHQDMSWFVAGIQEQIQQRVAKQPADPDAELMTISDIDKVVEQAWANLKRQRQNRE